MAPRLLGWLSRLGWIDVVLASLALVAMAVIPLIEVLARPLLGRGVENAPVLVQHLGLLMAMFGALAAERHGHLTTLGTGLASLTEGYTRLAVLAFAHASAALICGMLALASWTFVASEMGAARDLAYGLPVWWVQAAMPLGFALLGAKLGAQCGQAALPQLICGLVLPAMGAALTSMFEASTLPLWPWALWLLALLLAGAPIFAALGGLALA
ncbi:MAG: hypothetical protein RL375_169, partial [Pseudomonadota bacterium]